VLTDDVKAVSVDDHLIEHPRVWQDRLPKKYLDAGPRIVDIESGGQQWCYQGVVDGSTGLSAVAGTPNQERGLDPRRFDEMRPGYYDPVARLADMDLDGVSVQLNFPNWPGFAGSRFLRVGGDMDLNLLCVEAYNDFVIDEWCAAAPDRYIPLIILPLWDPDLCVAEIQRCAPRGVRAIAFPDNPALLNLPSFYTDHWDKVFSAAEDADLVLCMHFGGSGAVPLISSDAPNAVSVVLLGITLFDSMTEIVLSPVFHNHPRLKIAYSEGEIGWLPYAMMRIDQVWEHYRHYRLEKKINADVRPSDLIRQHIWGCFIDDPVGIQMRHEIGVDRILWESDYPHADSLFPRSRSHITEVLTDVPDKEAAMIVEHNARSLFRFGV
jgi:predicted TIM-barrel fold metal-dependent hydrolase